MSRVAKAPVVIPANVEVTLGEQMITVKGPKGSLKQNLDALVCAELNTETKKMHFKPASGKDQDTAGWAQAGTARALVSNMVKGVAEGFEKRLDLVGVGYRAQTNGKTLTLSLGFSHPIEYKVPEGIQIETPSVTNIIVKGMDKQAVGEVAAQIRAYRPPEPYKGKGVKYTNETIARKEAKKK